MVILLFAIVVIVGIVLWKRQSGGFTEGFATLLDDPVAGARGPVSFLTGREHVGGEFGGRPVVMTVHHRRGRYDVGYLIVAMQPKGVASAAGGPSAYLWDLVRDPEGREALSQLEKTHRLRLEFEDGWLKATWMPIGLFVFFPGKFVAERWRAVLTAMRSAAASMESARAGA